MSAGPPRRSRGRRWFLWLGLLVVAGAVVSVARLGRTRPPPLDPAMVVTAARKPLAVEILETGRVQPRERVELKSKVAGQVAEVRVQEGASVKKGQVLVVLDPTDYQRDVARADADVAMARAALDYARVGRVRAERGVAESVMPRSDLDLALHEARSKEVALRASHVAQTVAQDHLRYTQIVSPIDGTVIQRGIEPGESVVPGVQSTFDGKSLLVVANLDTLLVKVNLNQIDVAKVSLGRKATLTLDALPGKSYEAELTKIAPASVKLAGKDQEVFPVEARILSPDGSIKPGMTADVRIHLDEKAGVLSVPLEAIVRESGKTYVNKIIDDKDGTHTDKVEVVLGLRNDRDVEIQSGLDEGTRVLLKPPSAAENETKL